MDMKRYCLLVASTVLAAYAAAPAPKASLFPISEVRVTGGLLREAMMQNGEVLLRLSPDRLLAKFREQAGLAPKAPAYGGWESTDLAGHSLGHYLSAVSMMFAASGDARFKERVDYIVDELVLCQKKNGRGFVDTKTEFRPKIWEDMQAGRFLSVKRHNFNGAWAPWYEIHKVYAGLRDAWQWTGNAKAKEALLALSGWTDTIIGGLSDDQLQQMLACEFGGMNEVLADAYAISNNPLHLALAKKFYHKAVMDPLREHRDALAQLHANTQVPKVIGEARLYEIEGREDSRTIAEFFWRTVIDNYTYANGGNSDKEWFGQPKALSKHMASGQMTETCNTYNMLKLTTHLFGWEPRAELMDYYERALWNQIYSSHDRKTGQFTYKLGLYGGYFQSFSRAEDDFWCCVGTGYENPTRYGEAIYFHGGDRLWVNLFIPSEVDWKERGVKVVQETNFPEQGSSVLKIQAKSPVRMALAVRYPRWAQAGFSVRVNGKAVTYKENAGSYVEVYRTWKSGDTVTINLPMALRYEPTPDNPKRGAFFYGPVLLAGLLGTANMPEGGPYGKEASDDWKLPLPTVPVLKAKQPLSSWITPVDGRPLTFEAQGVTLAPVWQSHHQRFTVYWDID